MTNHIVGNINVADLVFDAEVRAKEGAPNDKIDTEKERTIFSEVLEELKRTENLSDDDINKIWDIALNGTSEQPTIALVEHVEVTNDDASKAYETTENNHPEVKLDKNQKKMKKNEVLGDILKAIGKQSPLDWDALKDGIKGELKSLANEPYYQQLLGEVNQIVDKMKSVEFNSRKDVENLYATTRKALADFPDNEFKSFRQDVLKNLIKAAEKEQMQKEKNLILDEYNTQRAQSKSREDAVKAIKNDSRFKGSYFEDYSDYDIANSALNMYPDETQEYKGVISLLEEGEVMTEARQEVWDVIYSLKDNPEFTEYSDIKKEVKKRLTQQNGDIDKYTQKVLNGERSFSEKMNAETSLTKAYMQKVATDNTVESIKQKGANEKYFTDELKNDALFEGFKKSGLVTAKTTEDGKPVLDKDGNQVYDLSKLSDLIRDKLGANSKADKQLTEMKALSEIQQVLEGVLSKTGEYKLSTKDTKRLIKLCGFPVEKKNWWKITVDTLDKTFTMGLVSTAGALVTPREVVRGTAVGDIPYHIDVNDNTKVVLDLNINGEGASMNRGDYGKLAKEVIKHGGSITSYDDFLNTGKLEIILDRSKDPEAQLSQDGVFTDQELDYSDKAGNKTKGNMVLNTLLFSLATNFLMSALNYEKAEKPMIETQFKETNLEEYEKRIDASQTLSDNYKEGLKYLASAFKDKDGNWDVESYKQLLNRIAGDGGILNKAELEIGIFEAKKEFENKLQEQYAEKPPVDAKPVEETKPAPAPAPVEEVPQAEEVKPAPVNNVKFVAKQDINMKNSNKYYWEEIIQKFYGPALEAGVSEKEIRFKLREVNNNILNKYKAIPPNLLIPQDLFGDGRCIRTEEKPDSEIKMRPRDETEHPTVKAHRTPDGKWYGGHEVNKNDAIYNYRKSYNSKEDALKGAEEDYNKNKQN